MTADTRPHPESQATSHPSEIIYLIGFSPSATETTRDRLAEALPIVKSMTQRNIDCWYVRVDRTQFEGDLGEKNLSDMQWLGPKVLAHQMAVETLSGELPFFPAHFGALFSGLDKLATLTQVNWRTLTEYFAEDALNVEWGLKCLVNWPRAVEVFQDNHPKDEQAPGAGRNYLLKKKMIRDRDEAVREWINQKISETRQSLSKIAVRHRALPTNSAAREGDWECIQNWAILVTPDDSSRVEQWIRDTHPELLRESSMLRLQLTGPWPLYSFLPSLADESHESSAA